ncbi:MAG: hypothetical protein IJW35_08390 [Lentisphaeria bacterium]|nr:hypothetical protein [Lentisphaeria bacterium]
MSHAETNILGNSKVWKKKVFDFSLNEINIKPSGLDNSNVQSGCWGQGGGDTRNLC